MAATGLTPFFTEAGNPVFEEAALSPQRQLALLVRIHELVNNGCQLIISTHSPILLYLRNSSWACLSNSAAWLKKDSARKKKCFSGFRVSIS